MSIKDWIKLNKDMILFFISAIILLIASFGIGFLMGKGDNPPPIIIEKCSEKGDIDNSIE